jgi:xylan 1,4-beta-xylosidase
MKTFQKFLIGVTLCALTDTPHWAPGIVADPAKDGDSGSIPVTINKVRAMNAKSQFSSEQPGRYATYAVDNSSGTWWEPNPDDAQPTLTVDLGPATRFDVVQLFTIDSLRLLFTGGGRFGGRRGDGLASADRTPPPTNAPAMPPISAHQYKIDVSTDGNTFTTVLDQSTNALARNTIFAEIPPTQCRLVRLTMINWPRTTPLGIIEFTVFGKPTSSLPAVQPIAGGR